MQWVSTDAGEVLIGGQTFVHGQLEGFGNEAVTPDPKGCSPFWKCWPMWVWIVAGIGLLTGIGILLATTFNSAKTSGPGASPGHR